MSMKAVLLFVVLALVLAGVSLLVTRKGSPPSQTPSGTAGPSSPGGPGAPGSPWFDPAAVSEIAVAEADGRSARVTRTPGGGWTYASPSGAWPAVPPEGVQPAIASLAQALIASPSTPPPAAQPGDRTITLGQTTGPALELRISAAQLGGKAPVLSRSGSRESAFLLDAALLAPLLEPGPRGWRVPSALPGAADASRITLTDPDSTLVLARLEGRWDVRRPISARASQTAVNTLTEALGAIRVQRFEDARSGSADLAAMGLSRPRLVITCETDERVVQPTGEVRVQVRQRDLVVGGPADTKGDSLFVATDLDGSMVMVVAASSIAAISTAPRNYLAPTASGIQPADVFMLTIRDAEEAATPERAFRRNMANWVQLAPDGSRRGTPAAPIDAVLEFFAQRPGVPEPAAGPEDFRVLRRVEFFDDEGDSRDILSVGYTSDGALVARSGNMLVTYRDAAPDLLLMPSFATLGPAPVGPGAVQVDPGAPTQK